MTLDELLDRLEGVRPAGHGYVAVCPAHDDSEASLGVTDGDSGLLLTCYAGCETKDVVDALGLEWNDLYHEPRKKGAAVLGEPEAIYVYTDEVGEELFQSLRYRTDKGKTFRQRHHGESGEWVGNMEDVRRVLYHLPEVIQALAAGQTVYIVEGEKDADILRAHGKVATCNPMGAGKWRPEFVEHFAAAMRQGVTPQIIVWADRDEPGRNHAEGVRNSFLDAGVPVWAVVQSRFGKDATDHLEGGGTIDLDKTTGFKALRQQRRGTVTTSELAEHARERLTMTESDLPAYLLAPGVDGLKDLFFRQGRMYAIGAYTGHGKTCLALQGFRALSMAEKRCGYFSLEMPEIDLMNRLVAHKGVPLGFTESPWTLQANPEMLERYHAAVDEIAGWNSDIIFESAADANSIRQKTLDREYEAIFIDHLHRFSWKERNALGEEVKALTNIALEMNVMVVVLCQLRKYERGGKGGFVAYPRPTLQDFRETSQIGDDASMALAVWRQTDDSGLSYTGPTEVIILKNRHTTGPRDAAGHSWMPTFDDQRQLFVPPGATAIPGGF